MTLRLPFSGATSLAIPLLLLGFATPAYAAQIYQEAGGFVVIEAESADLVEGWIEHEPEVSGARGTAVRFTAGQSICSSSTNVAADYPALEYRFRISESGTYRLKMNMFKQVHCVELGSDGDSCHSGAGCQSFGIQSDGGTCGSGQCWRSDISNDAYVTMETAEGDGVPFVGGGTQLMKFFGGSSTAYAFSGNDALDHHAPDYDLIPGDYVLHVRGRSRGFSFDRLVLFKDSENDAKNGAESALVDEPGGGGSDAGAGGGDAVGTGGALGTGGGPSPGGSGGVGSGGQTGLPSAGGTTAPGDSDDSDDSAAPSGEDSAPTDDSEGSSSDTGGCSTSPKNGSAPLSFLVVLLSGLVWLVRGRTGLSPMTTRR